MSRPVEVPLLTDDPWTCGTYEILKMLFFHVRKSNKTYDQIAREAGLHPETFKHWKTGKTMPALDSVLRCLHVLGYTLVVSRAENNAFAHDDYFDMTYEFECQRAEDANEPLPPRPGSKDWITANQIHDDECLGPTPEDIERERRERATPQAERLKARESAESRRAEERAALFKSKQRKKKKRAPATAR